jgi:hypothetical protein
LQENLGLRIGVWDLVAEVCWWHILSLHSLCRASELFMAPAPPTPSQRPPHPHLPPATASPWPRCSGSSVRTATVLFTLIPSGYAELGEGSWVNKRTNRHTNSHQGPFLRMTLAEIWHLLHLLSCVTGGQLLNLSVPQFPSSQGGDNRNTHLMLLWEFITLQINNEIIKPFNIFLSTEKLPRLTHLVLTA